MYKYRLHYLRDGDDGNWKTYESEEEVSIGDVLQLACGFYHCVIKITKQKTGVRLDVSQSAQSPDEAVESAKIDRFLPKD